MNTRLIQTFYILVIESNIINIIDLSFGFPQKDLFEKVSFSIEDGQHLAFIGASGNGKTTLIEMIMDTEKYMYDGKIEIEPGSRIGYVSQFYKNETNDYVTVFEYLCAPFLKLQAEIDALCLKMETAEDIEPILEAYQNALDAFDAIGGHDYETDIIKKLNLANLGKHRDLNILQLSGGEFKIVQVIREMVLNPQLIIMDEPDVFLDFENLNALKDLINTYKGMLLVITHNRYLLNHCFNKIIHLENKLIQEFEGNFIEYNFALLQTKIEQQELSIKDDAEIERNEALIGKLRTIATYNTEAARGKALKARVKVQERLVARRIKAPFVSIKKPYIKFVDVPLDIETPILSVSNLTLGYESTLIHNATFDINYGDKVAIIGANGTGKTTLFRAIHLNQNENIIRHEGVKTSYLSQLQGESLDESKSVIEAFYDVDMHNYQDIKAHIRNFGFDEAILKQKITALSGGEKNLLQIAIVSALHSPLLLLDEPTSHLDTYAQIALEQAIEAYKGTVLMISHDYYTIANTVDYILLIENQTIRKVNIQKFRKMIYENHFSHDYLVLEQKKKMLETKIELALSQKDFETAKKISGELEEVIDKMIQ